MAKTSCFYVTDNGIGFDMAHAGKLFEPFQQLHTRNGFEGSGIGLASVRRIIERHGGSVWVESAPGAGTTVFFTLPPQPGHRAPPTGAAKRLFVTDFHNFDFPHPGRTDKNAPRPLRGLSAGPATGARSS